ncbi:MAG: hypothetical protein IJ002_04520 [Clostridia bacterium]|nr:hypothetical protein [Clostridia bacterium]
MKKKRKFGDRKEGRRLRTLPPISYVSPYLMPSRTGAQNLMADTIEITETDKFLRELRANGYKNISVLHIIIAAYVRVLATRPALNRFCSGQKLYHRNDIEIIMTVKRDMSLESEDTVVKVKFEPDDTLMEVYEKFNAVVSEAVAEDADTDLDKTLGILTKLPGFVFRIAVAILKFLDYYGFIPQSLLDVSPFHGSMVLTSLGSLGIPPVFHHLYDFGNAPLFIAYGRKYSQNELNSDGSVKKKVCMDVKLSVDERVCDGYYFASAFKMFKKMVASPEVLMTPPEEIIEDID